MCNMLIHLLSSPFFLFALNLSAPLSLCTSVTVASVDVLLATAGFNLSKRPTPLPLCCHLPVIRLRSTVGVETAWRLSP